MFALDTNLFMFPGPRRLLSGIAHVTGQPIGVLPQVERELIDNQNLAKAEAHRWAGKSKRQGNPVQKTKQAYRSLVHPTVKQWFYQHLLQQPIFEQGHSRTYSWRRNSHKMNSSNSPPKPKPSCPSR